MWHLAQLNVGRTLAPLESATLAGFVERLDPINALADAAPGFVWRLQTDAGSAVDIKAFPDDELMIVNLSVWESLDTLSDFVYRSGHLDVLRARSQWFERMDDASVVLWWVPAGTIPTVDEARARLDLLRSAGPTADAFTFRTPFPPLASPEMDRPPTDPKKLLAWWMEWEKGETPPGRVMSNLKTGGLRELLEELAAAAGD